MSKAVAKIIAQVAPDALIRGRELPDFVRLGG